MTTLNTEDYKGYRGVALNTLQKFKTPIWSDVEILTDEGSFKGLILPRSETADEFHIVLKMPIGYNIGIAAEKIKDVKSSEGKKLIIKFRKKNFLTILKSQM
jgi:glutamyl-tRNA(Gln) amidotransferase subunit D